MFGGRKSLLIFLYHHIWILIIRPANWNYSMVVIEFFDLQTLYMIYSVNDLGICLM